MLALPTVLAAADVAVPRAWDAGRTLLLRGCARRDHHPSRPDSLFQRSRLSIAPTRDATLSRVAWRKPGAAWRVRTERASRVVVHHSSGGGDGKIQE